MQSINLDLTQNWAKQCLIANLEADQINYLQIDIPPVISQTSAASPLNLVMVLDRSGSMAEESKLLRLKEAVCQVIDLLRPQDYLGVVLFDERPEILISAQPVGTKVGLKDQVMRFSEHGGTRMSLGLDYALQEVTKNSSAELVSRVLMLTDGQTWGDELDCIAFATAMGRAGVPLYTFGLGQEWNVKLLQQLATQSGGQFGYLETADMISTAFNQLVNGMQQIVAAKVQLLIQLALGVQLRAAYRLTPLISELSRQTRSDRELQLVVGDIEREQLYSFLLEFSISTRPPSKFRLAKLQLDWQTATQNMGVGHLEQDLILEVTNDPSLLGLPPNPAIMNSLEKAQAFHLQTIALDALTSGNKVLASAKLKQQANLLLNMGEAELSTQVNLQADQIEKTAIITNSDTIRLGTNLQNL